ncbi:MAG: hypothetical protein ACLTXL_03165 [Clostridia bacterium]
MKNRWRSTLLRRAMAKAAGGKPCFSHGGHVVSISARDGQSVRVGGAGSVGDIRVIRGLFPMARL